MDNLKHVHILGIGGCACSAVGEYLNSKKIRITGSEMKLRHDLTYLIEKGIKIAFQHGKENIHKDGIPDILLYSPAIEALNPDNPELMEAKRLGVKCMSWEKFIGIYLNQEGRTGITISGSEGKGTTAGILTTLLKETPYDPLAILGAQLKSDQKSSNIYMGKGSTYILEGDEYNRNFYNYHPAINVMINFKFEHPETYSDFQAYCEAFAHFFQGMSKEKKLILHATKPIIAFAEKYAFQNITWFGYREELEKENLSGPVYSIEKHHLEEKGNHFTLHSNCGKDYNFFIPALPGYIALNAAGAILAAKEVGVDYETIKTNLLKFKGMKRRFDLYRSKENTIFITDYGHSPESIHHIIQEIRTIFANKKLHIIFQPHLYSRTYNFLTDFAAELSKADKISLIDIYPAREKKSDWEERINSKILTNEIRKLNSNVAYCGPSAEIYQGVRDRINPKEITCFMGAGDMDLYYEKLIQEFLE